jgi:hypothetical protein
MVLNTLIEQFKGSNHRSTLSGGLGLFSHLLDRGDNRLLG